MLGQALGAVVGAVEGTLTPVVRLPLTLLHGVEQLVEQLGEVAERAGRVIDEVEGMPARVAAVLDRAEAVPDRIEAVLDRAEAVPDRIDAVLARADALTAEVGRVVADAAGTLAAVQPAVRALAELEPQLVATLLDDLALLVGGARQLDPALVDHATTAARGLPALLGTVDDRLLPALASLEQLVPVVGQLAVQVDHLDTTVAEVGALLGGIPGAGRLLKRGETRPARPS